MNNIWSKNRYVNIIVNILFFLMSINFIHYGQFALPIICLILFIDRRFVFRVNNNKTFLFLCLFSVAFFVFSYKLGFYSVMGFCFPMAYYIGSNMYEPNDKKIIYIIYLIAFGMVCHLALNFYYDTIVYDEFVFRRHLRYDFWTKDYVSATTTAVNCLIIFSSLYYVLLYERRTLLKAFCIFLFIVAFGYNLCLGRRTPFYILFICVFGSALYDAYTSKNKKIVKRSLLVLLSAIAFVVIVWLMYEFNILNFRNIAFYIRFFVKLKEGLINADRLNIFMEAIKLAPYHIWGGQEISTIIGINIHDFWSDLYDYAGIFPFIIMIILSFIFIKNSLFVLESNVTREIKVLFFGLLTTFVLIMFIEPMMTGSSLFVIIIIIVCGLFERLSHE